MQKSGFIAIVGRPNAGKSTLLNRILSSEISIVTPKAQTTREKILGILTESERGQIVFVDTPGIHRAKEGGINACMLNEAREALVDPSLVWYLVDPKSALEHELPVLDLISQTTAEVHLLMNKSDIAGAKAEALGLALLEEAKKRKINVTKLFRISALKGEGTKELMDAAWALLPEGPLYYPDPDQLTDRPVRYFVGEKIREQLFLQLGDELPYSCAVEIEKFEETPDITRIQATIYVERDSQKGIVVGKGGQKIKSIGQAARVQVEAFLAQKVFLGLQVKVLRNWTRDADFLRRLGYTLPTDRKTKP